ncbi:MAG TPA: 3-methyl-2-oxobutanoate hydroxymethyltransferase [Bdellovibrionales bacterium]|nr:3-methyl-2-oxobutanoate hydroxymethyltransferase [Bdellovibrionales bacterium]
MKSILDFPKARKAGRKVSMVTCYDYTSARIVADTNIDCILVGDSLAMTMHGDDTTLTATPDLMALHIAAVRKGAPEKFLIGDLPFLAHRGSMDQTLAAVRTVMKAGAQAVKIEGIDGSEETIRHLVQSGVPVMGHLGMTPQSVHQFGGFRLQATSPEAQEILLDQAKRLEACGVFAIVLECVPTSVARYVTEQLEVPTIGIGAGPDCSGQVLVFQDMLGLNEDFKPRFVRKFLEGAQLIKSALNQYDGAVKDQTFPSIAESYEIPGAKHTEVTQ